MGADLALLNIDENNFKPQIDNLDAYAKGWSSIQNNLRTELGDDVFTSWFARAELEQLKDDTVTISVPTKFLKSWIQSHYRDKLLGNITQQWPEIKRIDFIVRQVSNCTKNIIEMNSLDLNKPQTLTEKNLQRSNDLTNSSHKIDGKPKIIVPQDVSARNDKQPHTPLSLESAFDTRCTFENFSASKSNNFAYSAAKKIAEETSGNNTPYNPLFIHGGVGIGKTHLLHAIGLEAQNNKNKRVVYLTAEKFMYEYVSSVRNQSTMNFKESLRTIDMLLMDDLQFLQGKNIQQEFCHVMNALLESARTIVVAADRLPSDLENLESRVRSRLGAGLVVEIGTPDENLRFEILKTRAKLLRAQHPSLTLTDEILKFIAASVATNGRDLEGALNRVVAQHQFSGARITEQSIEECIKDLIKFPDHKRVKIEDIQRIVAKHYTVSRADLLSNRRTQTIVRPRQVAMYLAKILTPRSLPEIGRRFGGRDHTTVLHAVRKIELILKTDPSLKNDLDNLKRLLEG